MQSQVTQLNSDLTPSVHIVPQPSSINGIEGISIWTVLAIKSGKTVCLHFNVDGAMAADMEWKVLFTLPQEYRPSVATVIVNYNTQKGKNMAMTIDINGNVRIVCPSGEAIEKGDWICRQCITYITRN